MSVTPSGASGSGRHRIVIWGDLAVMSSAPLIAAVAAGLDEHTLAIYLGAVGVVIVVSGIVSGVIDRAPVSQVLVFVALGFLLGPSGFGAFDLTLTSPVVQGLAVISLTLVLFTDAITINLGQLRSNWVPPALALGPGAIVTVVVIALAAVLLFGLPAPLALLVGAILASTDAVLLRDLTRDSRIPLAVRHTLSVEAGANDLIVLPLVLSLAAAASGAGRGAGDWLRFLVGLIVLAPLVGIVIALVAIEIDAWLRRRRLIRREYESLYSIGVAFVAFAAAQLLGGSGFLAAFAAGLTISFIDVELCDCFLEYGETTAEVAMLLTFVLLGSTLVLTSVAAFGWRTLVFASIALGVARPLAMLLSLARSHLSRDGKAMLAWFGPRGLNSLLLLILALSAGVPRGDELTGIVGVVVLASILLHGMTATPLANWYGRRTREATLPEETAADAGRLLQVAPAPAGAVPRMTPAELKRLLDDGAPVTIVDTRRAAAWNGSRETIPGAIRMPVDEIPARWTTLPNGPPIVLFCT
ncbi:MAG TPA: cation:proton antiporter [Thermomicrobiales bacterium]|nr:cation:proton antiporter [Thermomicrobiales bacterium]